MVASLRPASSFKKKTAPTEWIWPSVIAAGSITLMTSRWKTGKTTLLSVLLSKLGAGGALAGRPIAPTRAIVLSEESEHLWEERHARLNFADSIRFACRPFRGRPTLAEWTEFLRELAESEGGPGLLVLDPLAMFLPGNAESYAPAMIDALTPLHRLTDLGWAVLILHHPIKGRNGRELTERSTGALTGFVDIVVKLYRDQDAVSPRIRRLECIPRDFGFGSEFRIELSADGRDFAAVPEEPDFASYVEGLTILKAMLEDSSHALTRMEMWKGWLEDFDRPSLATLRRWLWRAEEEGVIEHRGSGRRNDAFRYGLKGREVAPPPMTREEIEETLRLAKKQMREGKSGEK